MLLIVTSTGDDLFLEMLTLITLNDLEPLSLVHPPPPPEKKLGGFSEFFEISGYDPHFKSELRQNIWR